MLTRSLSSVALLIVVNALLCACGKKADDTATQPPPASRTVATPASNEPPAAAAFDINSVPLSSATLPPFPYLDWPSAVPAEDRKPDVQKNFDGITVIAAEQLLDVEGKLETRVFKIPAEMSQLEVRRNYANLIQQLGGVQVNKINPVHTDNATISEAAQKLAGPDVDVATRLGLRRYDEGEYEYEVYLVRTADTTAWIVVQSSQFSAVVTTLAQQAMAQSVALISAEAMKQALDANGHIALYINFDTDAATLRPDAAPTVAEITKLLYADPVLKVGIEGHTDNSGTSQRNAELSLQRANAVTTALTAAGIDKSRLTAAGFGQDRPVADNATEEGRAKNRRVELVKR